MKESAYQHRFCATECVHAMHFVVCMCNAQTAAVWFDKSREGKPIVINRMHSLLKYDLRVFMAI